MSELKVIITVNNCSFPISLTKKKKKKKNWIAIKLAKIKKKNMKEPMKE